LAGLLSLKPMCKTLQRFTWKCTRSIAWIQSLAYRDVGKLGNSGLAEWMRKYNVTLPQNKRIGFYGLDVYSLWESLEAIINYLDKVNPKAKEVAMQAWRNGECGSVSEWTILSWRSFSVGLVRMKAVWWQAEQSFWSDNSIFLNRLCYEYAAKICWRYPLWQSNKEKNLHIITVIHIYLARIS